VVASRRIGCRGLGAAEQAEMHVFCSFELMRAAGQPRHASC
jgi:hypothetical protein